jgi:anion-transporting  ArsA/GET3 family ATPase
MRIDPFEALAEYLGLQLHARGLVDRVLQNKGFRQLLEASPGWRELITLGKVWHLAQQRDAGRPLYDLIIVDAPATGHGLTFIDVPRVVASAVRTGPLRSNALLVEELIDDPKQTLLLPVALAEELPAQETVELVGRAQSRLGISIDRVVVNAVEPDPYDLDVPHDLDRLLARIPADTDLGTLPAPGVLAACARHVHSRFELNAHYTREIEERCGLPIVRLANCPSGFNGAEDLAAFAAPLLAETPPDVLAMPPFAYSERAIR